VAEKSFESDEDWFVDDVKVGRDKDLIKLAGFNASNIHSTSKLLHLIQPSQVQPNIISKSVRLASTTFRAV
jgi:hypothetical protein